MIHVTELSRNETSVREPGSGGRRGDSPMMGENPTTKFHGAKRILVRFCLELYPCPVHIYLIFVFGFFLLPPHPYPSPLPRPYFSFSAYFSFPLIILKAYLCSCLSNLDTQWGQSNEPNVKSHMLFQPSQPGTLTFPFPFYLAALTLPLATLRIY